MKKSRLAQMGISFVILSQGVGVGVLGLLPFIGLINGI